MQAIPHSHYIVRASLDIEAKTPLLEEKADTEAEIAVQAIQKGFPLPSWTRARKDKDGRRFPQTIAHRGYKAKHPENTLAAFKGAVSVGTHAIETDIHLSRDDVVVLSHDSDLKRCFGINKKIIDCDWEYLSTLRTLKLPKEPMPQLRELLEYAAQPELQYLWILLDIKLDNQTDDVMRLIADTIKSVEPGARPWNDRIVLGIWAAKFLPLCTSYLPDFPVTHIGFSTCYARQFLNVPNVSFNMLQKVLLGPIGANFIKDVKDAGRQLFTWTVNDDNMMRWCIQKQVDGVITDDPRRFREICDNWTDNEPIAWPSLAQWLYTFWLYMLIGMFFPRFKWHFPETVDQITGRKAVRGKFRMKLTEG